MQQLKGSVLNEDRNKIKQRLDSSDLLATQKLLWHFDKQVPHRFLSPWFPSIAENRNATYKVSQTFENNCLYAVDQTHITINPIWIDYLSRNAGILKSFCYWKLSLYFQKHNPNVPDIPNKLIKPAKRNSLLSQRKFWNRVLDHTGPLECIYTHKKLVHGNFAVEHFIPYAFVSHDLIWNLIPADPSFNSRKNDRLPRVEDYFDGFYQLQKTAIKVMSENYPKEPIMDEYLSIFPRANALELPEVDLRGRFLENIQPLLTIASNNGFEYMSK
ncbi:HNH endonuclease domain-containing protein [Pedobacter sp. R-06]|uniref:HNH endonuclease domain-containing protein n=1 Tax=Pedobacter sp. R-06 TaxID=3404051 RepID=UPI003CE7606E